MDNLREKRTGAYIYGVITLLWMGFIFYLSGQPAAVSQNLSQGFLRVMLENLSYFLAINLDVRFWHLVIRKGAHVFLYTVLGVWMALYLYKAKGWRDRRLLVVVLLFCFLYAVSDEVHQALVPGRSGEIRDVFLDSGAAFIGTALWRKIYFRKD